MKTRYFFSCLLIGFCTAAQAQQFTWAKNYGINSTFTGIGITSDLTGNVYLTGSFSGSGDQDPSQGTFTASSNGSGDIFIAKLDPSGNMIWLKSMGGIQADAGAAISVDGIGNVYVAGNFRSTVDFDPGPGTYTIQAPVYQSIYDSDAFLLKLDKDGNFVWAGAISGEKDEFINGMVLANNKLYVTGMFGGTAEFDIKGDSSYTMFGAMNSQAFIATYDLDGNIDMAKMIDGDSRGDAIAVDAGGNIYSAGFFMTAADFDPSAATLNLTSAGGAEAYVWKLNSAGDLVWARSMGGTLNEFANALAVDASGNAYLTGYFQYITDLDPGPGVQSFTATPGTNSMDKGSDIFVLKLSSAGNFVWAKAFGGIGYDHGDVIALDMAGNLYVGGIFKYTVDFDPSYNNAEFTVHNPHDEVFLTKMTTDGDFLWAGRIEGSSLDAIYDLHISSENSIYLTGFFRETADLDPTGGTYMVASAGVTNAFVIKLNGAVHLTFTGLTPHGVQPLTIYPNPASGSIRVNHEMESTTVLRLYNNLGALMFTQSVNAGGAEVNLDTLPAGIYIAEISDGMNVQREKIVIK
jgi:hypothetical protein